MITITHVALENGVLLGSFVYYGLEGGKLPPPCQPIIVFQEKGKLSSERECSPAHLFWLLHCAHACWTAHWPGKRCFYPLDPGSVSQKTREPTVMPPFLSVAAVTGSPVPGRQLVFSNVLPSTRLCRKSFSHFARGRCWGGRKGTVFLEQKRTTAKKAAEAREQRNQRDGKERGGKTYFV